MDIRNETKKTLADIRSAKSAVNDQRFADGITDEQRSNLEKSLVTLNRIERQLISDIKKEIVNTLKSDSKPLKDLAEKIKESAGKLNAVAENIEKAAKAVESFIKVLEKGISSGLI